MYGNEERVVDGVTVMYKRFMSIFLVICLLGCTGCDLLEGLASDVGGWDVSACVSGFDTCWELFTDNADKFEGGFVTAIDGLSGGG